MDHSTGPLCRHFATYDGNGNLVATVNASSAVSSRMEFGPFGEVIRRTATVSVPFQWSTRYTDTETDLTYYGFRFYDCRLGRWIGRDPIEEDDTVNLYAYVRNGPLSLFDRLGKNTGSSAEQGVVGSGLAGVAGSAGATINFVGRIREGIQAIERVYYAMETIMDIADSIDFAEELLADLSSAKGAVFNAAMKAG